MQSMSGTQSVTNRKVPWFGARKFARELLQENSELLSKLEALGALSVLELEAKKKELSSSIEAKVAEFEAEKKASRLELDGLQSQIVEAKKAIVATEETVLLQESGVYQYQHPLSDAVAYERELERITTSIKDMVKADGGAIKAITDWTVNGSAAEGRRMVRDFSKLMLRAFNAEADNLVRALKPYKLNSALDRLKKVADTIERLGRTMKIEISTAYFDLRVKELKYTADFLNALAEQKELERQEREKLREEKKAQQEIERERARLEKERQHYLNALEAMKKNGDDEGIKRLQDQITDVDKAIVDVDYRAANIRAGYVYVISNLGSFGEEMVKVGMTRRLDPLDRIKELSDASVPFNFDVHALFFSKDAVTIETTMHEKLADRRVNAVNRRREFFRAKPSQVKTLLSQLTGELLEFQETAEALEYRQTLKLQGKLESQ